MQDVAAGQGGGAAGQSAEGSMTVSEAIQIEATPQVTGRDAADDQQLRFEQEAIPYMDRLYPAALHLTSNHYDAEDLIQETFAKAPPPPPAARPTPAAVARPAAPPPPSPRPPRPQPPPKAGPGARRRCR